MHWLKQNKVQIGIIVLLLTLSLPAVVSLFHSGFVSTDDGNWMVIRFSAFYQAIRSGQFPIRFLTRLNFGYGYPVANFLYPGFMYIGVPLKIVGFGYLNTIKILLGTSMILSGLTVFLFLRKFFDYVSAFFGGLFYVYLPYHLYDLTKRGSVGELLSMAIAPFVLWQVERQDVVWIAIGIFVLMLSHNTLALMYMGLIVISMGLSIYISKKKEKMINKYLLSLCLGLAMSSFFWLPAILELPNTVFSQTKISDFSKYFADPNLIGISSLAVFAAVISAFVIKKELIKKHRLTILLFLIGIISSFFSSALSSPLWSVLPVSFIQFPFRTLSVSILCSSFLAAFVLSQLSFRYKIVLGTILILATVYFSKDYIIAKQYSQEADGFYSTNEATTTVMDEYMPKWVKQKPIGHFKEKAEVIKGQGNISDIYYDANRVSFNYDSASPAIVQISTIYYPGWRAFSNGVEKSIFYDNKVGLIDLKLEQGNQKVTLVFGETPTRIAADLISIAGLLGLIAYVFRRKILGTMEFKII